MERCNMKVGGNACGQTANNWCFNHDTNHNHNVCDEHWDRRKKTCRADGAPAEAAPQPAAKAAPRSSRGEGPSPPVRSI